MGAVPITNHAARGSAREEMDISMGSAAGGSAGPGRRNGSHVMRLEGA